MVKRRALGKGLSALIPDAEKAEATAEGYYQCPIELIEPNPMQPRQDFDETALNELVQSIREKGIITPALVSKTSDGYRLIAGERRWRAAQKAGLKTIPVIIRETNDIEALEIALIENIQRKDLNPIEEALAYKRLINDTNTTQEVIAKRVGKERSTIANMLRLLTLPKGIQKDLVDSRLSMGHARVLAGVKDAEEQVRLRDQIISKDLSVRQTENLLKKNVSVKQPEKKEKSEEEHYIQSLADGLKRALGTKVEIKRNGKKGQINIYFFSDDELGRLLDLLS